MDTLSKSLYSVVSQTVDEFAQLVADKYKIPKTDVLELWNTRVSSELKVLESVSKPKEEKKTSTRTRAKADTSESSDSTSNCEYEFKKGKNIGTKCTAKVCSDSTKFCRKHKAQEGKEDTEKSEKKTTKATKAKKADVKEKETAVVKKLNEGKQSYVLHRNKQGNYEHPDTKFVFDKVSKEVYGKQTDSGVVPLTAEDIETCRKSNFKYRLPDTLTKKEDTVEEEEDDVEEEDDDVDEDDEEEEDEN